MPKILKINAYSLNMKVTLLFFLLSIFLLCILFLLIIPKMQKEQLESKIKQAEQMIMLSKEQIQTASKAIKNQSIQEKERLKLEIHLELNTIISKNLKKVSFVKNIQTAKFNDYCTYYIKTEDMNITNIRNKDILEKINYKKHNSWESYQNSLNKKTFFKKNKSFYINKVYKNLNITIICDERKLNPNHKSFEEDIKQNIQESFSLSENIHKGKTYLVWINHKYKNETTPLYQTNYEERKKRYVLSNISNVQNISTGNLSAKDILKAKDKQAIIHNLNGKKTLTWVKDLSLENNPKYIFLLITNIHMEDLNKQYSPIFWQILPASIIALFISIITALYLLKKLFKNIKSLDSKVEEKTKELKNSLDEKEILLKEIHHRVKNNLALTIGLIKLQESKIKDRNTKKALKNIQERIYTMELLHRKLYESNSLNQISFNEYVKNLTDSIISTHNKKISIKIKIEDIYFDIEKAMPLGLIINELLNNSLKYAFKKKGKILIKLIKKDDSYQLFFKDNGIGLNKNIKLEEYESLGLKLIYSISKYQIKGNILYKYKKGAVFKINFPF